MGAYFILGLIVLAAIFLIWGIIYIIKGLRSSSEEKLAIPISDLKEIKKEFPSFDNATILKQPLKIQGVSSIADHVIKENLSRLKLQNLEAIGKNSQQSIEEALEKINQLKEENKTLNEALQRELSSRAVKTLSIEEQNRLNQTEEQYKNAQNAINILTEEKIKLEKELDGFKQNEEELKLKLSALNDENEKKKKEAIENSKVFKEEIVLLTEEQNKLRIDLTRLNLTTDENDKLKAQHEAGILKIKNLEEELSQAKELLFNQSSKTNYDLESLKKDNENLAVKLKEALKNIEDLQVQVSHTTMQDSQMSTELTAAVDFLEKVRLERDSLAKEKAEVMLYYNKLKELNASLLEKEKILQYELTKSRAKALGLERICEDFKLQIEGAAVKK